MKTKILILTVYLAFVIVSVCEWRALSSQMDSKEQAIAAWQRLDARLKSGAVELTKAPQYLRAYEGFAQEHIARDAREQKFIVIAGLLTLPLALFIAATMSRRNAEPLSTAGAARD